MTVPRMSVELWGLRHLVVDHAGDLDLRRSLCAFQLAWRLYSSEVATVDDQVELFLGPEKQLAWHEMAFAEQVGSRRAGALAAARGFLEEHGCVAARGMLDAPSGHVELLERGRRAPC